MQKPALVSCVAGIKQALAISIGLVCLAVLPLTARPDAGRATHTPMQSYAGDPYWQRVRGEIHRVIPCLQGQHRSWLLRHAKSHKLKRGNPHIPYIALTFDDGPHARYTPQLLDILDREGVKATFFIVGEKAKQCPYLVRREVAMGHDIGNHTYHHVNLKKIPQGDVMVEIKACGETLREITGIAPHLFRPPGGDYNSNVTLAAEALGYTTVLWTDDPGDYARPGANIILRKTLSRASNGGIILLHDGIPQTMVILPKLIETLKKEGYHFVTVDQMIKLEMETSTP